jgi:hypothetical protein
MKDLWMYDGGIWTWMWGSSSDSYGEKGVPSPSNAPPARYYAVGWRDNDGNLWMFGGGILNSKIIS